LGDGTTSPKAVQLTAAQIEENRAALADQTTMLATMADGAVLRLGEAAERMRERSDAVNASARALGDAASGAERSVEVVLSSLPKAHEELRGLAATVENVGLGASERAGTLDAQLSALSERGREADNIAGGAAQKLAAHLARMESTSETASARLERVTAEMSAAVDGVLERAARAIDEARNAQR